MLSRLNMTFPETGTSTDFNDTAAKMGWPILCDESCAFNTPMLADLLTLWQSEATRGIPARSALTVRKLQPFLRNIAIYERVGEGAERRYRIRLMGSGIVQHYGELTGKLFEDVVPQQYLDRWYATADVSLLAQKPVRMVLRADTFDKAHWIAEYLCAPLTDSNGSSTLVLMGMIFDGRRPWADVEAEVRKVRGQSRYVLPGTITR
jgi:hypothetical protein